LHVHVTVLALIRSVRADRLRLTSQKDRRLDLHLKASEERVDAHSRALEERMQVQLADYKAEMIG